MSQSIVAICNAGLIELGEDTITSLTDDVKAARLCNQRYEALRDSVLRAAKWNFALERARLALLVTSPPFGFSNQFQLPTNCLRVLKTDCDLDTYKIEGKKLLTNRIAVKIQYIKQVTDPVQFDALFVEAFSAKIAMSLAIPLTDSDSRLASMKTLYDEKIAEAKGSDAQENGSIEVYEADEWVNSRIGNVAT
jgi:hypothetical protein